MLGVIVGTKHFLDRKLRDADALEGFFASHNRLIGSAAYVALRFGRVLVYLLKIVVSIPLHLVLTSHTAFERTARRTSTGEFLDSYSQHLREQRHAVLSFVVMLVAAGIQLSVLGFGLYEVGKPTTVLAYSTTVSINPSWDNNFDRLDMHNDNFGGGCDVVTTYECQSDGGPNIQFGRSTNPPVSCDSIFDFEVHHRRPAMKFSLSSIPNGATITNVELIVNVTNTSTQAVAIRRISDSPDALACDNSIGFDSITSGTLYDSAVWSTTGSKTLDLGATADADVQSRLTGSDFLGIGFRPTEDTNNDGQISSLEDSTPSNRPVLRVTYTQTPTAPSGTSHSSVTTSSVTWTWTDNTTGETRYDVHDSSHANVTGCTNLSANSQSCTETGLSANTQYTRHPNVTDADGNTDGPTAMAYTAQNVPSGMSMNLNLETSITMSATGTLPNLTSGSSGLYFENVTRSTNSGWVTTNSWNETGLNPNTQYQYRVKARNGDGVETAFTATTNGHTTSVSPDVSSNRTTSTWYTTPSAIFTNTAGFGDGGVEYYLYAWNQNPTYGFTISEPHWDSGTLNQTAGTDGNNWYLHLSAFDGTDTPSGGEATFGPYFFDATVPTAPAHVFDGSSSDVDTTTSTTSLSANWGAATDTTSGLERYDLAIGTTPGATNVLAYTSMGTATSAVRTGLALVVDQTYYVSVRAIDVAGNIGNVVTSDGITVQAPVETPEESTETEISGVTVTATETTATILWTTNEAATSKVRYGLTSAYGAFVSSPTLVTSHSLKISGLTKNTTYHFQVVSTGTTTKTTSDDTFTTTAGGSSTNRAIGPTLFAPTVSHGVNPTISFTGVAKGEQTVRVYLDGKVVKTLKTKKTFQHTTIISFSLETGTLKKGSHTLYAQSTDQNDRTSVIRQRVKFTTGTTSQSSNAPTLRLNTESSYVVQAGDSLWSLSAKFLGDGQRYMEIVNANASAFPSLVSAPNVIQPGWVLQLPAGRT